jgi:hypothetical protein
MPGSKFGIRVVEPEAFPMLAGLPPPDIRFRNLARAARPYGKNDKPRRDFHIVRIVLAQFESREVKFLGSPASFHIRSFAFDAEFFLRHIGWPSQ